MLSLEFCNLTRKDKEISKHAAVDHLSLLHLKQALEPEPEHVDSCPGDFAHGVLWNQMRHQELTLLSILSFLNYLWCYLVTSMAVKGMKEILISNWGLSGVYAEEKTWLFYTAFEVPPKWSTVCGFYVFYEKFDQQHHMFIVNLQCISFNFSKCRVKDHSRSQTETCMEFTHLHFKGVTLLQVCSLASGSIVIHDFPFAWRYGESQI